MVNWPCSSGSWAGSRFPPKKPFWKPPGLKATVPEHLDTPKHRWEGGYCKHHAAIRNSLLERLDLHLSWCLLYLPLTLTYCHVDRQTSDQTMIFMKSILKLYSRLPKTNFALRNKITSPHCECDIQPLSLEKERNSYGLPIPLLW